MSKPVPRVAPTMQNVVFISLGSLYVAERAQQKSLYDISNVAYTG